MIRLYSLLLISSFSFFIGCGSNTAATPSAVDDSVVHTPEVMVDMQQQAEADATGSN